MKFFLIWLGLTFINEMIGLVIGFKLGYVLLAVLAWAITKALGSDEDKVQEILPYADFEKEIPETVKAKCRELAGVRDELETHLKAYADQNVIKHKYVASLLEEFAPAQKPPEEKQLPEQKPAPVEALAAKEVPQKDTRPHPAAPAGRRQLEAAAGWKHRFGSAAAGGGHRPLRSHLLPISHPGAGRSGMAGPLHSTHWHG